MYSLIKLVWLIMKKLIVKSTLIGFIIGSMFFVIAPLGLGLTVIEFLKPVLIPGVTFIQLLGQNTIGVFPLTLALFMNVIIYSILVMCIFLTSMYFSKTE